MHQALENLTGNLLSNGNLQHAYFEHSRILTHFILVVLCPDMLKIAGSEEKEGNCRSLLGDTEGDG